MARDSGGARLCVRTRSHVHPHTRERMVSPQARRNRGGRAVGDHDWALVGVTERALARHRVSHRRPQRGERRCTALPEKGRHRSSPQAPCGPRGQHSSIFLFAIPSILKDAGIAQPRIDCAVRSPRRVCPSLRLPAPGDGLRRSIEAVGARCAHSRGFVDEDAVLQPSGSRSTPTRALTRGASRHEP